MTDSIKPFRGLRYNFDMAGKPETLLAPPYDVISPAQQDELYKLNEYNIVRLILGKEFDTDTPNNNRYTRSAADLESWLKKEILKRDETEAIYVYAQSYEVEGTKKTRIGFVARKILEDFGGSIVPHEKTLAGPKADRLNLTRACRCNFSQIFGLYTDKEKKSDALLSEISSTAPDITTTTNDGLTHSLWGVTDTNWISRLASIVSGKSILIADGHHRYETALNYYKEMVAKGEATEDVKYVMMYFTNTESEGLTILPTHRLIFNLKNFNLDDFLKKLESEFSIEKISSQNGNRNDDAETGLSEKMALSPHGVFGLYSGNGNYHFLKYKGKASSDPLDELDVGILHNKILEAHLGIGQKELAAQSNVKYSQEIQKTAEKVDSEGFQLAFFLNPTPVEHMQKVTSAGLKMPQKSTYFYPKLVSGLVINPLY
ncbi:MAG: DUF1015 domain-containing protein [Nitrospinota bacterium]|nr:DUF1015 domain-containing protein [Nitrospinota bacterium]